MFSAFPGFLPSVVGAMVMKREAREKQIQEFINDHASVTASSIAYSLRITPGHAINILKRMREEGKVKWTEKNGHFYYVPSN